MSALSKKEIVGAIEEGKIKISPCLDRFQLQSHAVDLRLGYTFLIPKSWQMTEKGREAINIDYFEGKAPKNYFDVIELEKGQYFELLPNEYVLVSTLEKITLNSEMMAVLYPRSSTNRKGLSLDLTGIIDAGYEGQLAMPIKNNTRSQTIRLYPGERFCQIVFENLTSPVETRTSRYHHKDIIEGFIKLNKNSGKTSDEELEISMILSGDIKKIKSEYSFSHENKNKKT